MKRPLLIAVFLLCSAVAQAATVNLDWKPSATAGVSYNVYRGSVSGGPYTKVNAAPVTTLTYTDAAPAVGLNVYVVTAINGVESIYSNQVSVTIPGTPPPPPSQTFVPLRIKAGPAYIDTAGQVWSTDTPYCTGGTVDSVTTLISGTNDGKLYQSERWNNSTCAFAVPAGSYLVTIKFAEIYFNAANRRVFGVTVNGITVLSAFDVFASAAGSFKSLDKTFPVTMTAGGNIVIRFVNGSADDAKYGAIQIVSSGVVPPPPPPPPPPSPLTLNCVMATCTIGGVSGQTGTIQIPNGPTSSWRIP